MSAIYYCDNCGTKMRESDHGRICRRLGKIEVEVIHCLERTWNAGNVCHKCITETVQKGKTVRGKP